MSQEDYNAHYDSTAAAGLCWAGDGNPVHIYRVTLKNGRTETVESLWCFDCNATQDADVESYDFSC